MPQPEYDDALYIRAYDNMGEVVYDFWKAGCTEADLRNALDEQIENGEAFD